MPLCTTTTSPVMPRWGWALRALGSPWVAQRVWPMPACPCSGDWSSFEFRRGEHFVNDSLHRKRCFFATAQGALGIF
ncbi:MAG: hypothetical protein P8Z00_06935, partial [Anaerolineales bacterium]